MKERYKDNEKMIKSATNEFKGHVQKKKRTTRERLLKPLDSMWNHFPILQYMRYYESFHFFHKS